MAGRHREAQSTREIFLDPAAARRPPCDDPPSSVIEEGWTTMETDAHVFLASLAIVLVTAAVTTVVFQRLRQPIVLGYLLAGVLVGPHVPFPLVADPHTIETLSELGVILLMFSLGLEFSFAKLVKFAPTAGVTALVQCSAMVWLGFVVGRALGWTPLESGFAGAVVAISSTTIIAKAFDEQNVRGSFRDFVVGILVIEDLIGILLIVALTAISSEAGVSAVALGTAAARLAAFLVGLVVVGLFVVPRGIRAVVRLERDETTLVASVGVCFLGALLALEFGYSVALGAFIAGSLVAESGEAERIEHLVKPVKDVFAAIFFVSVGMLIDPSLAVQHWLAILLLTIVVFVGKISSVGLGAFLTGNGTRTSVRAGMSLAQIGEFSFIIAGLGLALGATRDFLGPVAVAVSALTTLTTPWLIRASEPAAMWVDRKLPHRIQTFASLYERWLERIRRAPRRENAGAAAGRLGRLLAIDAFLLAAAVTLPTVFSGSIVAFLEARLPLDAGACRIAVGVGTIALALPFAVGIVRVARKLGLVLAESALPPAPAVGPDPAAVPRRALAVSFQLVAVLVVGLPLLAITQPFTGGLGTPVGLAVVVIVLGFVLWRSATSLEGQVRAGAQLVVDALATQTLETPAGTGDDLSPLGDLLRGLGEPTAVRIRPDAASIGKTLSETKLRERTGASVLAIVRDDRGIVLPAAGEALRAGDLLAIVGSREAVEAARQILEAPAPLPEREAPPATARRL
jgi:K+:H+ antiporter